MPPSHPLRGDATGEVVRSAFAAPWWLRSAHAQTVWASLFRRPPAVELRPERITTPDGDFLDLAWSDAAEPGPGEPVVLLIHGLAGSMESIYIHGIITELSRRGVLAVAMNLRGAGDEPNRHARSYHSGAYEDMEHVLEHISGRFPGCSLRAAGVSLGGNLLLCHAGHRGSDSPLDQAVAICPPIELARCLESLSTGVSRLYQRYLLRGLQASVRPKGDLLRAAGLDVEAILGARNFREYDEHFTAPAHGFGSAEEYYAVCSSRPLLRSIRVPTTVLFAADDPFMHPSMVPEPAELSPFVRFEVSEHGGHVGFVQGVGRYWLDERVPDALLDGT